LTRVNAADGESGDSRGVMSSNPKGPETGRRRSVFLPKEHGSWSLALEPVLLGMLAAPTLAGCGLALATVSGFFARRPIRAALGSGTGGWAGSVAAASLLCIAAAVGIAVSAALGGPGSLWPLGLSLAPCGLFLWFDLRGDSRTPAAEIAGAVAFAFVPAAFATLAGRPPAVALALAATMLSRSVPAVLVVREYLRRRKGGRRSWAPLGFALLSAGAMVGLSAAGTVNSWVLPIVLLMFTRYAFLLLSSEQPRSARRLGTSEAVLGIAYILGVALAFCS